MKSDAKPERWKSIEPEIKFDLVDYGIELDPPNLPEIFAKVVANETNSGKGILLMGNVGSGKSKRMKQLATMLDCSFKSAETFGEAWREMGENFDFQHYCGCVKPRWDVVPKHWNDLIIDDIGTEERVYNSYGNSCDVMSRVIMERYKVFPEWKTHFTTNLNREQLLDRYGERIYSRLNEMCLFVKLNHGDRRKR
jgi:energy-coupling factor transporter ATP-binding protein EcfA2